MIVCDICKQEVSREQGINMVELAWPVFVQLHKKELSVIQYHLCVECSKKVNEKIQELIK